MVDYDILSERLKVLKKIKEELQVYLDSAGTPFFVITEEMVLKYLSATQGNFVSKSDQLSKKKIVDLYVHEVKVFSDKVDVILNLDLCADKDGVGGGT